MVPGDELHQGRAEERKGLQVRPQHHDVDAGGRAGDHGDAAAARAAAQQVTDGLLRRAKSPTQLCRALGRDASAAAVAALHKSGDGTRLNCTRSRPEPARAIMRRLGHSISWRSSMSLGTILVIILILIL